MKLWKKLGLLAGLLLGSALGASAQGYHYENTVVNQTGRPVVNAGIYVCLTTATGTPCSPITTVYSDIGLNVVKSQPIKTGPLGNYDFYLAPNTAGYTVSIIGSTITSVSDKITIPCTDGSVCGGGSGGTNYQTVQENGTPVTVEPVLNLKDGTNTDVVCVDNPGNTSTDCHIDATSGTGAALNADNIFTNNDRFKGPIPYRDFTAYMPAGGCASTNLNNPTSTGTISASSHTLAVSSSADYKTGCGVTIDHAGPTATIANPTCTFSSASGTGAIVTITCTGAHNLVVDTQGVKVSGCSGGSGTFNGVFYIQTVPASNQFTYNSTGTGSPSSCVIAFQFGWQHGVAGSTTYNYKIAPVDAEGGMGPASAAITITNGNLTLGSDNFYNYNWIGFNAPAQGATGYKMMAIYSDGGLGGAYSYIGVAFGYGYSDYGFTMPRPSFIPSTPPASATAQSLTSIVTAGGGTTSLTLTDAATTLATAQNVYDDVNPFLTQCLTDLKTDQATSGNNAYCYIPPNPPGTQWRFSSDFATDTVTTATGGRVQVAGYIGMSNWPWFVSNGYTVEGIGSASIGAPYTGFPVAHMQYIFGGAGDNVPGGFVLPNIPTGAKLKGWYVSSKGDGVSIGGTLGAAGINLEDMVLDTQNGGTGVPLKVEGNSFKLVANKGITLLPRTDGFPCSIRFTTENYNNNGGTDIQIGDLSLQYHSLCEDAPGGTIGESGWGIEMDGTNLMEDHGNFTTGGTMWTIDNGNGSSSTPGAGLSANKTSFVLTGYFQSADATNNAFVQFRGSGNGELLAYGPNLIGGNPLVRCHSDSSACSTGGALLIYRGGDIAPTSLNFTPDEFYGPINTGGVTSYFQGNPFLFGSTFGGYGNTPSLSAWGDVIPGPRNLTVTSTSSGSLSAGTYCMVVVGLDAQTPAGLTLASPEVCQTVGASSDILLSWDLIQGGPGGTGASKDYQYSDWRLYYGSTPGGETNYIDTAISPSGLNTVTYTFTSTAGNVSASPPTYPTAELSWLERDGFLSGFVGRPSCLLCSANQPLRWQLGIGDPAVPATSKVSVKGGNLNLNATQLRATKASAPTCVANTGFIWFDTSADKWKFCNDTGSATTVAGLESPSFTTPALGAATATSLGIGGGTVITKVLSATATLDFGSLVSIGCEDLTITVTGAALGDTVAIGVPNGSVPSATFTFTGWVSAADTVKIRGCALVSGDPASGTFRATVFQF